MSVLSRVCNEVERLTTDVDYADVDLLKSRLQNAWSQYEHCCGRYFALLDDNCEKYNEVKSQYLMQRSRELYYEEKLQQICQECQPCHASSRTTTKPIIQSSEAAECAIHIEMKTLEIEIKKKELELEFTRLESELEETKRLMGNQSRINLLSVCSQVREQSDCASPTHDVKTREEVPLTSSNQNNPLTPPSSIFSSTSSSTHAPFTPPASSFPSTSNSTDIPWSPPVSIPRSTSTERTATGFTPPMSSFRRSSSSTVRHPVSQRNPPFSFDVLAPQTPRVSSVLSAPVFTTNSLPQPYLAGKPPYASTPMPVTTPMVTDPPQSRNVSGLLPPNHYGGAMTTNTPLHKVSTEYTPDRNGKPSSVKDESIFTTIASAIANISLTQDLPKIQVQKFDGSPERFPTFRQRFRQLVETRALDDAVKMTLLLHFLEGPALKAVQRYEALPGGLTSALKTLEERFGRPSQVVRACVDALTKGPVIQNNDRQALQQLAEDAQVAYDTLESMGYLREINTDNLERIVARLPKWAQTKFIETVNKKRKDKEMPSFKDVVEFLKDRADVVNHPFFSKSETATKIVNVNPSTRQAAILRGRPTPSVKVTTLATSKKDDQCFMCSKTHRLYRCELFKSKNPKERNEFVKAKKICFNCLSSTEHNYKNCKCSTRCQVSSCGKAHHSMLHFTDFSDAKQRETSQPEIKRDENDSVNTTAQSTTSTSRTNCTIAANNQEVMLQVLPVKIINEEEPDFVTTYCLIDSGSDVTLIDPSLAKKMNLKGTPGNLVLNTVSNSDVSNQATKVSFKLACLSEEEDSVVNVETAWAMKGACHTHQAEEDSRSFYSMATFKGSTLS